MGFKMQKFTLKINLKFAFLEIVLLLKHTNEGINISAKNQVFGLATVFISG